MVKKKHILYSKDRRPTLIGTGGRGLLVGLALLLAAWLTAAPVFAANPFAATTLSPSSQSCAVGTPCSVDLIFAVPAGGYVAYGIDAIVSFDATKLQVTSVTGRGVHFPTVVKNIVNNTAGFFEYSATGANVSGATFAVATIVFNPIATGTSILRFNSVNEDIVGYGPFGVNGLAVDGSITVTGPTHASTTTTETTSLTPALLGQPVTLTATVAVVAPSVGTPTGTVTFIDVTGAPVTLGTGTLNPSGVATLTTSAIALGNRTIAAQYAGEGNFSPSAGTVTESVFDFAITLTPADTTVAMGDSVTYTVTTALAAGSGTAPAIAASTLSGLPANATSTGFPATLTFGTLATFIVQTGLSSFGNFTLTVTGAAGSGTRTTTAMLHILTPQGLKNRDILALTPYVSQSKNIGRAIEAIQDSLDPKLWVDPTHIDPKHGDKVFDNEKHAVEALQDALQQDSDDHGDHKGGDKPDNDNHQLTAAAKAAAQQVIVDLTKADRILAAVEIRDAQNGMTLDPHNAKDVAKDLSDALSTMAKGDAARDAGKPATAIDRYREAWHDAGQALQDEAKKPKGEGNDIDKDKGSKSDK